jgi:hypothetical protein
MPTKQRRRRDDEHLPASSRQDSAGRRQEDPVSRGQRRTAGASSKDREFVSQHDDFQVLEIVRSKAQDGELKNSPKKDETD